MKLKNVLILAFFVLTLIPIAIVSTLLYKSSFTLSKESYTRNLTESINVQADYILQTMENNMISDYRFAYKDGVLISDINTSEYTKKDNLVLAIQSYLEASEDKVTICILLDKNNIPLYTIGEEEMIDTVKAQFPILSEMKKQAIMEFELAGGGHSLGIVTPVRDANDVYVGSLISIYDEAYIFKIISSYYKVVDTSTYICRSNGDIINSRRLPDEKQNTAIEDVLYEWELTTEGVIDMETKTTPVLGYYKNISNTSWYLVGFIDDNLIYSFMNQFIWIYILVIIGVLGIDIVLSLYLSKKVVKPINELIKVMDGYQNTLNSNELQYHEESGYFETQYLQTKFIKLMQKVLSVQHNFEGIYKLYQSGDMADTNIDIDIKNQTAISNKENFQKLMDEMEIPEGTCVVERFVSCFCENDQVILTDIFGNMRDEHLSISCEVEVYTPHLDEKWFHVLVAPMYENDKLSRLFIQLRDISNFKKQEFESTEQARRDSLTGLYNRAGFIECVNKVLEEKSESALHALFFMDMDFFKMVNDNLGHKEGDNLLCSVGRILNDRLGPEAIVSRFGGDEFAIFLPDTSIEDIARIKKDLNKILVYPYSTGQVSFVVSASIGVSTWNNKSLDTFEQLLQKADDSMYQAKRDFKRSISKGEIDN